MLANSLFTTGEAAPYWAGAAEGRLLVQHCPDCARVEFPPKTRCTQCGNAGLDWRESALSGRIDSFALVERAPNAAFREKVPYVIALVSLPEGGRIMMNVLGPGADQAKIGDEVRIVFETRSDGLVLPQAELL